MLILMMGSLDVSGVDYFNSWVALAFKVDSARECARPSSFVPELGGWFVRN